MQRWEMRWSGDTPVTNEVSRPAARFDFSCDLISRSRRPLYVLSAEAQVRAGGDRATIEVGYALAHSWGTHGCDEDKRNHLMFALPMSAEVVSAIDRARKTGGVTFQLFAHVQSAAEVEIPGTKDDWGQSALRGLMPPASDRFQIECKLSRDQWLDLRKRLGFGITEVFELEPTVFPADIVPKLTEAAKLLQKAVESISSDATASVTYARKAHEAVVLGSGGKRLKQGWAKVLSAAFPGPAEAEKREAFSAMLMSLGKFCHASGRHASRARHERAEAEFAVIGTLAALQYLNACLKRG